MPACLCFVTDIVTVMEQENDEHDSLVSVEKPMLETFEGNKFLHFKLFLCDSHDHFGISENTNVMEENKIDKDALENGREGKWLIINVCLVCICLLDGFVIDNIVTAMAEQENDEHDPLISAEQPMLETFEGTYICGHHNYMEMLGNDTMTLYTLCSCF